MQSGISVREITPDDWPEFRDIRLRMLAEIPLAFGETLERSLAMTDAQWARRVRDYATGSSLRLGAIDDATGAWVGTMGGFLAPYEAGRPLLVGVYVAPEHRGSRAGVTDALLGEVERWARQYGDTLRLHVHEDNRTARAAYARRGFVESGVTQPYPLDRTRVEYEMAKVL